MCFFRRRDPSTSSTLMPSQPRLLSCSPQEQGRTRFCRQQRLGDRHVHPASACTRRHGHGQRHEHHHRQAGGDPGSLAVQVVNDVGTPGPSRGDTLQYTINFQVSDFALENPHQKSTDLLSDGQSFDAAFTPTIDFTQHGVPLSGAFPADTFSVSQDTVTTGQTTVDSDVAQLAVTPVIKRHHFIA